MKDVRYAPVSSMLVFYSVVMNYLCVVVTSSWFVYFKCDYYLSSGSSSELIVAYKYVLIYRLTNYVELSVILVMRLI